MINRLEQYFDRLWPLNRSITGNGLRQSLDIIGELVQLRRIEIASGTNIFDWKVPPEWEVKTAYIQTPDGRLIANYEENNLHLMGYSIPIREEINLEELKKHLYTIPDLPYAVPYITSYYGKNWGFCLTHNEYLALKPGIYKVVIDSQFNNGSITLADAILPGKSKKEILISTYLCHPSMANNELSGPLVSAFLYEKIAKAKNRYYTYRFIYTPETIGTIAYLNEYKDELIKNVYGGLVITCIGDSGKFTYKTTRSGKNQIDDVVKNILKYFAIDNHSIVDFEPIGSDERQYSSPGFNFAVGSLMRTMYGKYKEYHTSKDDKNFISFEALEESIVMYERIIMALEINHKYINLQPFCEPCLGKRALYPEISGNKSKEEVLKRRLFLLNYSDGNHSLLDIAKKLDCCILDLYEEVQLLIEKLLIKVVD